MIRQADVQHRPELQVADVLLCRIAGKAEIVTHDAFEITAGAEFRQHSARTNDRHHLPFTTRDVVGTSRRNDAKSAARSPLLVDLFDQRRLKVRITDAIDVVARWMIGRDGIFSDKRQIGAKYYLPW